MTADKATTGRNYEAAYCAHQITTANYRALKIGDAEFLASVEALKIARDAHEVFLFNGTDNENAR